MTSFQAYRIFGDSKESSGRLVEMKLDELDPGDVTIQVSGSGVNYKDALAGHGAGRVIERFPCNGGIEAVGTVAQSRSPSLREGDAVIAHGRGLGVRHDGGFASYLRAPAEWVTPLPPGLSPTEAAAIGVAGHTAALSIDLMELNGLKPGSDPVAVTGATGGVGSLALTMLAARGYEAVAVTRKPEQADYLRNIGASSVRSPPESGSKTRVLDEGIWAGAIDSTGGVILEWLIRSMRQDGVIATFGNAGGAQLHTTVFPFILRGVRLLGINGNTGSDVRSRIWERTANDLKPAGLELLASKIEPGRLHDVMGGMLRGVNRGRHVVSFTI